MNTHGPEETTRDTVRKLYSTVINSTKIVGYCLPATLALCIREPADDVYVNRHTFISFRQMILLKIHLDHKGCISDFRPKQNDHIHLIFPNNPLAL